MVSKIFRIAPIIVLASLGLSSAAWATCSNASVNGIYGFLISGTNASGNPVRILGQAAFNSTTATFKGEETGSINGGTFPFVSISGTYAVASNCTGAGKITINSKTQNFYFVVTSAGLRVVSGKTGDTQAGFIVAQGSESCTNVGIKGNFGVESAGIFLTGAPSILGPVAFVGELLFNVNASGAGVIGGHIAGSENGTIFTFTQTPVTGSYSVNANCTGTATITPQGKSALNYSFVVVNSGKELLAVETDEHTVVSGTLQR